MAGKTISGVSGVLGELISPAPRPTESARSNQLPIEQQEAKSSGAVPRTPPRPRCARLGRPPGKTTRHRGPKEKVTLRIPSNLIAEYRDWSWEARCQLSELVERALAAYGESRRR
jgi:uncharacterized protein (DUF4415 family)